MVAAASISSLESPDVQAAASGVKGDTAAAAAVRVTPAAAEEALPVIDKNTTAAAAAAVADEEEGPVDANTKPKDGGDDRVNEEEERTAPEEATTMPAETPLTDAETAERERLEEHEAQELLKRYGFGAGMRMYARSVALAALAEQKAARLEAERLKKPPPREVAAAPAPPPLLAPVAKDAKEEKEKKEKILEDKKVEDKKVKDKKVEDKEASKPLVDPKTPVQFKKSPYSLPIMPVVSFDTVRSELSTRMARMFGGHRSVATARTAPVPKTAAPAAAVRPSHNDRAGGSTSVPTEVITDTTGDEPNALVAAAAAGETPAAEAEASLEAETPDESRKAAPLPFSLAVISFESVKSELSNRIADMVGGGKTGTAAALPKDNEAAAPPNANEEEDKVVAVQVSRSGDDYSGSETVATLADRLKKSMSCGGNLYQQSEEALADVFRQAEEYASEAHEAFFETEEDTPAVDPANPANTPAVKGKSWWSSLKSSPPPPQSAAPVDENLALDQSDSRTVATAVVVAGDAVTVDPTKAASAPPPPPPPKKQWWSRVLCEVNEPLEAYDEDSTLTGGDDTTTLHGGDGAASKPWWTSLLSPSSHPAAAAPVPQPSEEASRNVKEGGDEAVVARPEPTESKTSWFFW